MAKKKRNRRRKKYFSFLSDERFKLTSGIFLVLFSLYLYLAFTSYFFTWKTDQSFEWSRVFSGPEVMVDNWAGKFGAFLANKFINHWFGIASAVLPFILLITGLRLINIRTMPLGKTTRILLVGTILLSIILSFMFGDAGGFLGSGPGGGHGYFLSEWFSSILGKVGTIFLLSILILAFALFSFESTLEKILSLFKKGETSAGEDTTISEQEGEDEGETDDEAVAGKTDESLQFKTRGTEFGDSGIGEYGTGTDETEIDETGEIQDDNGIEMTVEKKQNGEMVDSDTAMEMKDYDPTLDLSNYRLPSIELLEEYKSGDTTETRSRQLLVPQ
jgi:S-DNA-T family DNA segregation ATPase FtsK/SpoIIIE